MKPSSSIVMIGFCLAAILASAPAARSDGLLPAARYYQENESKTCAGYICILSFPAVPAGKMLIGTRLSCSFGITGPSPTIKTPTFYSTKNDATIFLTPDLTGSTTGGRSYTANVDGQFFLSPGAAGQVLVASVTSTKYVEVACSLAGRLAAP